MFKKSFTFKRKGSDDSQASASTSRSPPRQDLESTSPRGSIVPIIEENLDSSASTSSRPSISSISRSATAESFERRESESDPVGLKVIYTPENGHKVDIVFIHSFGGTSQLSWSKHKDLELFWPLTFLPLEPDVCLARILTFGYNINVKKNGSFGTSVSELAKDLLFDLKYAEDDANANMGMGRVPLIFVVHSMGGLILKEAYIQGQNSPDYSTIVKAISAITFLSTPHRGTNLAETLNRILQATFINSSKNYISELAQHSFTLQKLNEQFRHVAPRLDIVSFYETQKTPIGPKKTQVMVLERDSSILGYPGETSRPLDADHLGVCKYDNPRDPNYIVVRNVLKSLVSKIVSSSKTKDLKTPPPMTRKTSQDLKSFLAITELPDIDYVFFRDQWAAGTSEWILEDGTFQEWLNEPGLEPRLLWLHGGAAAGKSVMSSFIINSLVERGSSCQYFFIRFGDSSKRTMSTLLRSLAFQMTQTIPEFSGKVVRLVDEAVKFETAEARTIWERIFKAILFDMEIEKPLYWIIDGLDEADDPKTIIKLLSEIHAAPIPVRVLLVSRKTSEIGGAFQKIPTELNFSTISIEGNVKDFRQFIRQELDMSGSSKFKEQVIQRILIGAQNNFLWVRLAVERLGKCHTEADVEQVLHELPVGMEALYDRMAQSIVQNTSDSDKSLASAILQCVTCSLRVLTVKELSQTMDKAAPHASQILDFQRSVSDLCGGFVVIDNGGNVSMIHQTAREYLLGGDDHPFRIDRNAAHEQMFLACMRALMATGLRAKVNRDEKPEFLDYAAASWSSHLTYAPLEGGSTLEVLNKLLTGPHVLTWIHIVASAHKLRILVQASKNLSKYSNKRKEHDSGTIPSARPTTERELIESWAVDLTKIVGKFGSILRRNPSAIYKLIPPFCPHKSAIYQSFGKKEAKNLFLSGQTGEDWDDSLARMSLGFGVFASSLAVSGGRVALLTSAGTVYVYSSLTFEERDPIKHGERVYRAELNSTATLLATYGYKTTKIWEIASGKCQTVVSNVSTRPRPLSMQFSSNSKTLLVGADDRRVRSLDLTQSNPTWNLVAELEEEEIEGHYLNAANYMAINSDGSLVAVGYRGHPFSAWETDGPEHIGHCWRAREAVTRGEVIAAFWHPFAPQVIGLYIEGTVFKWQPYDDETLELPATGASKLALSRDGNFFIIGDPHGTIKVYSTADFCLIYQLTSQDTVLGLAFGPDATRFYDLRSTYVNVWEPNALMRLSEQTERGSDSGSESNLSHHQITTTSSTHRVNPITTLAISPTGRLYSYGTEEGTVTLHELKRGKIADIHTSKNFISTEEMCWSNDGKYLSFSDSAKKVFIMSIVLGPKGADPTVDKKLEIPMSAKTKGVVLQLLFHPDSSHLLVYTTSTICVISLESLTIVKSLTWTTPECKWIPHPKNPSLLLGFRPAAIHVLDWDLSEPQTSRFSYPQPEENLPKSHSSTSDLVDRVLVTNDKMKILVQISLLSHSNREKCFVIFDTNNISPSSPPGLPTPSGTTSTVETSSAVEIPSTALSPTITAQISHAFTFLSRERLIFLSKDFSICSYQLQLSGRKSSAPPSSHIHKHTTAAGAGGAAGSTDDVKELFSLPGDWISRDCLDIARVWNVEKALLCPRNGEVAVVECAAMV